MKNQKDKQCRFSRLCSYLSRVPILVEDTVCVCVCVCVYIYIYILLVFHSCLCAEVPFWIMISGLLQFVQLEEVFQ